MVRRMSSCERILGFEQKADPQGKLIPLVVRMKLDLAEFRIRLSDWQALSKGQRDSLVQFPVGNLSEINTFRQGLQNMLTAAGRESITQPANGPTTTHDWLEDVEPQSVVEVRSLAGVDAKWEILDLFARYVLSYSARKNDSALCRTIAAEMPMMRLESVENC